MMESKDQLSSLKRGLRALALLNRKRYVTGSDLARFLSLPRTTAARILDTLESEGFVRKDGASRAYSVTMMVRQLACGFDDESEMVENADRAIGDLAHDIAWPLAFATPIGPDMIVRASTDHSSALAIERYHVGATTPILYCSTGQCYLAHCETEEQMQILGFLRKSDDLRQSLAHQETSLRALVETIREKGYRLVSYKEHPEVCVGIPVFWKSRIAGGLVMRFLKSAVPEADLFDKYIPRLQAAADSITTTQSAAEAAMETAA